MFKFYPRKIASGKLLFFFSPAPKGIFPQMSLKNLEKPDLWWAPSDLEMPLSLVKQNWEATHRGRTI